MCGPSLEYKCSYRCSNAYSFAMAADLFASLLASVYSRWSCSAYWHLIKAVVCLRLLSAVLQHSITRIMFHYLPLVPMPPPQEFLCCWYRYYVCMRIVEMDKRSRKAKSKATERQEEPADGATHDFARSVPQKGGPLPLRTGYWLS